VGCLAFSVEAGRALGGRIGSVGVDSGLRFVLRSDSGVPGLRETGAGSVTVRVLPGPERSSVAALVPRTRHELV